MRTLQSGESSVQGKCHDNNRLMIESIVAGLLVGNMQHEKKGR